MKVGTVTIKGERYDVETTKVLCPGVGIVKQEATAIGWDGPSVVVTDKDGDEYNAPIIEAGDLD